MKIAANQHLVHNKCLYKLKDNLAYDKKIKSLEQSD